MTKRAEQILEQAKSLTVAERAELADQLLESIGPSSDPGYLAAWEAEIKQRIDDLDTGKTTAIPWEQVRDRLDHLGRGHE